MTIVIYALIVIYVVIVMTTLLSSVLRALYDQKVIFLIFTYLSYKINTHFHLESPVIRM